MITVNLSGSCRLSYLAASPRPTPSNNPTLHTHTSVMCSMYGFFVFSQGKDRRLRYRARCDLWSLNLFYNQMEMVWIVISYYFDINILSISYWISQPTIKALECLEWLSLAIWPTAISSASEPVHRQSWSLALVCESISIRYRKNKMIWPSCGPARTKNILQLTVLWTTD